ncbi:hypothetical protein BY458DRAFT_508251 [Sporodiniella umbellata]|nr:hypothetical protein BY458DRAFT_508251 [Sporodiniella umbellata]
MVLYCFKRWIDLRNLFYFIYCFLLLLKHRLISVQVKYKRMARFGLVSPFLFSMVYGIVSSIRSLENESATSRVQLKTMDDTLLTYNVQQHQWEILQPRQLAASVNQGTLTGVILTVLAVVSVIVGLLFWRYRVRSRTRRSKAAQFSARMHTPSEKTELAMNAAPFLSLPELAIHTPARLSTLSLGTPFRYSTQTDIRELSLTQKNKQSHGLKRLTQQLFSQPQSPRASLGTPSVASVQWVGFNATMDYQGQGSHANVHLAVKNAGRASLYTNDSSTQSTPRSPMFPLHLQDSV